MPRKGKCDFWTKLEGFQKNLRRAVHSSMGLLVDITIAVSATAVLAEVVHKHLV
jgi:hypothetical protein